MNTQLYNSRIIDTYLRLIKHRYNSIDVNILLQTAGMKAYEVADQGHWFTQDQIDRFYEKLVQLSGNEHISQEAGRYAASPEALGAMRQYALGLIGPAHAFRLINKAVIQFSRSSSYESRNVSANSVEIIVTPHEGVSEKPFQCENRIGYFEAVVMMYGNKLPQIEHSECIFNGAKSCRYLITWESSRSLMYKRIGGGITLLVACIALVLAGLEQWEQLKDLMHLSVPIIFCLATIVAMSEKRELKASLDSMNSSTDKLIEQINTNFNNALMSNEIGQLLSNETYNEGVLAQVLEIITTRLNFDRGLIVFANQARSKLILQADFGFTPEQHDLIKSISYHLDRPQQKGVLDVSFREQRPFLINDLGEVEELITPQRFDFIKQMGTRSFICCPIISDDRSIGLLVVDNVTTKRLLLASDLSRLMGIASVIGMSLRNVELMEAKLRHEKEQLKMEKLESLGILAGGIAHDFNNILTIIMGNISLAQMLVDSTHKVYKPLVEAEKASVRATELAHQLLTFARGGEPLKKVVSLHHLVDETISLVLHGSNIKATVDIPASLHAIEADEGQMSQVFNNLIINATQAMPGGGTLTITAQNELLHDKNPLSLLPGSYVCITIADQGCGISDSNIKKIFDPYFTTKPTGSGLGLASVHSIITKHGGHIGVTSVAGKGTIFTIHLPSIAETFTEYLDDATKPVAGKHVGGSILVMDDEEKIRDMTTEMLEYLGYQVSICTNGEEAITQYSAAMESGTPYSAIIMDLTIPGGMGGKEAAEQILAIDPNACLIVSSGYSNDPIMSNYRMYGFSCAVAKPYNIKEFGHLLETKLSEHKSEQPAENETL